MKKVALATLAGLALSASCLVAPKAVRADESEFCLSGWRYSSAKLELLTMALYITWSCGDAGGYTLELEYHLEH
jgi:hypothetical protein